MENRFSIYVPDHGTIGSNLVKGKHIQRVTEEQFIAELDMWASDLRIVSGVKAQLAMHWPTGETEVIHVSYIDVRRHGAELIAKILTHETEYLKGSGDIITIYPGELRDGPS